jgi:hypothetical protein
MEERSKRPRKVQVGPFRVPPLAPRAPLVGQPISRDDLVQRTKRHYREVALGPRPAVDVDAAVRQAPPRLAPRVDDGPRPGERRRFLEPSDGDDDVD